MFNLDYIALFEDFEFIEKDQKRFPALRAPFHHVYANIGDRISLSILISLKDVDIYKKVFLGVKVLNHLNKWEYQLSYNGIPKRENQFVVCEAKITEVSYFGVYYVAVYAGDVEIGRTSFDVLEKASNENA